MQTLCRFNRNMSQLRLITFDAMNTLFKVRGTIGEIYSKAGANYGIKSDPQEIEVNFRKAFKQLNLRYPNYGLAAGMSSQLWWQEMVGISFDGQLKSEILSNISSDLYSNFETKTHWQLFPEVSFVLQYLKNKDVKIGVLSNFDERLPTVLKELGVDHYFQFILASRNTKWYKPLPQIFHHAVAMVTQCSPVDVIHVGDNLELDYKAARNAGIDAYLLLREPSDTKIDDLIQSDVPEHKIITNLEQLCNLLSKS